MPPLLQEFATGHPDRDLVGQRLLRSGQRGLLHRDDAKRAAAVSGCCRRKKATPAGVNSIPSQTNSMQTALLLLSLGLRRLLETESFTLCRGSFRSLLPFLHLVPQMEAASLLAGMKSSTETRSVLLSSLFCESKGGSYGV